MMKIIKEPLLHFLLMGLVLFVVYYQINPETKADNVIVLNEENLLTFIQYRTKSFEPKLARQRWAKMSQKEKQYLLEEYVKEEVLYREALALGLNQDDYIIKRRLVQKVDFTLQPEQAKLTPATDQQLEQFLADNKSDYWVEPSTTFTHVFLKGATAAAAEKVLLNLRASKVPFSSAGEYGQRFLYHLNYVERTQAYVEAHFGKSFSDPLFSLAASVVQSKQWQGPFLSQHGRHLVLATELVAGHDPELAVVRQRVEQDYQRQKQQQLALEKLNLLKQKYQIKTDTAWLKAEVTN